MSSREYRKSFNSSVVVSRASFIPLEARHAQRRMSAETKGFLPLTGFTLIELLIVVSIISALAVIVIITLNPAELLKQARDSTRLSDLEALNKAFQILKL